MADPYLEPGGQPAAPQDLELPRARELGILLGTGVLCYARPVVCLRGPRAAPGGEAVVFDVTVERPQLAARPINQVERICAVFPADPNLPPEVLALRADFPLVPHTNLRPPDSPRSLCLDNRPWPEVSRRWTAAAFVERVRWWLAQTARGTLHQDDQPLEPLVLDTAIPLILPPDLLGNPLQKHEFLSVRTLPGPASTLALRAERTGAGHDGGRGPEYVAIALRTRPQPHGVIRHHPDTLDQLHALTSDAGLDLKREIAERLHGWRHSRRVRTSRLILLLSLPKQRRPDGPVEETDLLAVACFDSLTEVALKLGEWRYSAPGKKRRRRGHKGAARLPRQGEPIKVFLLRPVFGLTPARAAELNGGGPGGPARKVAVGAGALGSQVLLHLVRAGQAGWTVIDDDRLFPHNLQRHGLCGDAVGHPKAEALAQAANSLFDGPPVASGVVDNVLRPADRDRTQRVLGEADAILDLSASVAVARHLAWRDDLKGRRASLFLNPRGTDLVLLAEGAGRAVPLDCLEMQYYRAVLREPGLADHLRPRGGTLRYSTSCRDVSARIPTHLVALHAAIGAGALPPALERVEASVMIWKADPATLAVSPILVRPAAVWRRRIGEWTLTLDEALLERLCAVRAGKLPNETGGVLLGAYDTDRRFVYVVDTIPSPPDSEEWPTLYIRGCEGLGAKVADAHSLTGGQLEYVGEWHSHPDGCATLPSGDDLQVFAWLSERLAADGLPALMAIVGEEDRSSWYLGEMPRTGGWGVSTKRPDAAREGVA
jgi:hypothetical protein